MNVVVCPICGESKTNVIFRDFGYDEKEYTIVKCTGCTFCYLEPQPSDAHLEKIYSTYYGESSESGEAASHLDFRKSVFEDLVDFLKPYLKTAKEVALDSSLVDIGCGNGDFIALARTSGWKVSGAEISNPAVDYAVSKRGLHVVKSDLREFPFETSSFNVATVLDVLEHLRDPSHTLSEIHRILKPNGLLLIRVPNTPFQILKARVQRLRHGPRFTTMATPLHLNHFDANTLEVLVSQAGFDVQAVRPGSADGHGTFGFLKRIYTGIAIIAWRFSHKQIGNILFLVATKKPTL